MGVLLSNVAHVCFILGEDAFVDEHLHELANSSSAGLSFLSFVQPISAYSLPMQFEHSSDGATFKAKFPVVFHPLPLSSDHQNF